MAIISLKKGFFLTSDNGYWIRRLSAGGLIISFLLLTGCGAASSGSGSPQTVVPASATIDPEPAHMPDDIKLALSHLNNVPLYSDAVFLSTSTMGVISPVVVRTTTVLGTPFQVSASRRDFGKASFYGVSNIDSRRWLDLINNMEWVENLIGDYQLIRVQKYEGTSESFSYTVGLTYRPSSLILVSALVKDDYSMINDVESLTRRMLTKLVWSKQGAGDHITLNMTMTTGEILFSNASTCSNRLFSGIIPYTLTIATPSSSRTISGTLVSSGCEMSSFIYDSKGRVEGRIRVSDLFKVNVQAINPSTNGWIDL